MKSITKILFLFAINVHSLNAQSISSVERAQNFYENQQWQEAAITYNTIVEENKYNGKYYYNLAQCHYRLANYDSAIQHYNVSLSYGYSYGNSIRNIAKCYLQKGDMQNATAWIKRGLQTPKSLTIVDIISDSTFIEFRKTANFKLIYPQDSTLSREEKWDTDIKFLKQRFEAKHFDVFNKIKKEEWEIDFNQLLQSIHEKSNAQILVDIMKITAKIGDGHTFIRPPFSGDYMLHFYPFKLVMFEDGLYVIHTSNLYKEALGLRLTHVNAHPIEGVLEKISEVISVDNTIGFLERLDYNLMFSEVLHVLGITDNSKKTLFTFQQGNGEILKIEVAADTFNPMALTERIEIGKTDLPLYQQKESEFFWAQELKDIHAMYIKININLSTPDRDINKFYINVFDSITAHNIRHLIIDLRDCPGGNSFNNETLIKKIIANTTLDKENGLFTIIGRRTFSAAMNLTTDLETWTNTKFIGEPTGSKPNFIGETNFVTLPNTGLQVSISDANWQKSVSWDKRNWIAPDIYVQNSFEDFKNGNDNILDNIKTLISENAKK